MDLLRSAIRGLLAVADATLAAELRAVMTSGDDYASSAKPQIDWDDAPAREQLIDSRAKDAHACLGVLDNRRLGPVVTEAASLLATVVGQDLEAGDDGSFRIARRVTKDRVISTVDPDARHGRKTAARGFDGYKGHVAIDPETELITATRVTAGNAGDAGVAAELIADVMTATEAAEAAVAVVYGDSAYGTGTFQDRLEEAGITSRCKTQPPVSLQGRFAKDRFTVDLEKERVTCPVGVTAVISRRQDGSGIAKFGKACGQCPLRVQCTDAEAGRAITISTQEAVLTRARGRQVDPAWRADYRATRPKVERKLAHLVRRRHGGRRARVRGRPKVGADFSLLAAAVNLARLAVLGLSSTPTGAWSLA
jgi:hypothetical protein